MTPEELRKLADDATPGPWELDGIAIAGSDHRRGDVCLMGEPAQYAGDTADMCDGWEANARLIAQSPTIARDLADALEENARLREALVKEKEQLGKELNYWKAYATEMSEGLNEEITERKRIYILATPEALSEAPEVRAMIAEAVAKATRVKPLVWVEDIDRGVWEAKTPLGEYTVGDDGVRFGVVSDVLRGLTKEQIAWMAVQIPTDGTMADVIRACVIDAYEEDTK